MDTERKGPDKFGDLRRRAEELISRAPDAETGKPTEMLELLQELEVHQAELEIQNQELRRAQQEISSLHREYENLYQFAPCGYVTLDEKGIITRANLAAATILGRESGRLIGSGFTPFIPKDWQGAFLDVRKKSGQTGEKLTFELPLARQGEQQLWARIDITADRDENEAVNQWRMALLDISENKKTEQRLKGMVDAIPDLMFRIDEEGRFFDYKAAAGVTL